MILHPKALILGITGQIGQYVAQLLLDNGYDVYGTSRSKIDLDSRIHYIHVDFNGHQAMTDLVKSVHPQEIYNFVSPSNIVDTINHPNGTFQTNVTSLIHLCELIKSFDSTIKLFNASSIEVFRGHLTDSNLEYTFDDDCTDFYPISPYGISRVTAHWLIRYYREVHHLPFYIGIFGNVASPRLNTNYLLPKIIIHVKYQVDHLLRLGNLDIGKDFSHASDIARGIILTVHSMTPRDYVIASGQTYTLRNLVEHAYKEQGITIKWVGDNGYDSQTSKQLIVSDQTLKRSYERNGEKMSGQSVYLRRSGWDPQYDIISLIHEMYVLM